jgi:primosomal protein N' (replication factor Y) (superfamily II helicase)
MIINYDIKIGVITNMIESHMEVYDVVFPVNIGPLTYRCPEYLEGTVKPGMIVTAPLKNKLTKGMVLEKSVARHTATVKDIRNVHGNAPVFSSGMINLLKWISDYYLARQGLVLKNMLRREAFTKVKKRDNKSPDPSLPHKTAWEDHVCDIASGCVEGIVNSMNDARYRTFLLQPSSSLQEYSFILKLLYGAKNVLLLAPELSVINTLYPALRKKFGERVCLYHGELSRGDISESIENIISCRADIVLGTRSAVFAPMKKVSLIAVVEEHNSSYKQENSPCYNGRDVAVMRGYIEKATVMLSSLCPSIESLHNCRSGKYTFIAPEPCVKKPKIRIVDMRYEKLMRPYLSKSVIDASAGYSGKGENVMFVMNRRGHSTFLQCMDCDRVEVCPSCNIPLVFHKQDMTMKCHYCGYMLSKAPESCPRCRGFNLKLLGAGTQKLEEDVEELLGVKTLRLDSDRPKKKNETEGVTGSVPPDSGRIIVGTKLMTKQLDISAKFSMAAVLNPDIYLNLPDFRSAEKVYQEISSVIDKVIPGGDVFIQTRMPGNYLYKHIRNLDYASFFREELRKRRTLMYPPYSRLILIRFISKTDLLHELAKIDKTEEGIEILGPYTAKNRKGGKEYRLLLKSPLRGKLHSFAKSLIEMFKDSKNMRVKVDVDPTVI